MATVRSGPGRAPRAVLKFSLFALAPERPAVRRSSRLVRIPAEVAVAGRILEVATAVVRIPAAATGFARNLAPRNLAALNLDVHSPAAQTARRNGDDRLRIVLLISSVPPTVTGCAATLRPVCA